MDDILDLWEKQFNDPIYETLGEIERHVMKMRKKFPKLMYESFPEVSEDGNHHFCLLYTENSRRFERQLILVLKEEEDGITFRVVQNDFFGSKNKLFTKELKNVLNLITNSVEIHSIFY